VGRKEKEIRDEEEIKNIIRGCEVCRLGFAVDNAPYVVPVSFGFDGEAIFFHTGTQGKKIDCINKNSAVCFEFEREVKVLPDEKSPCSWTFSFESVIGYGRVHELLEHSAKISALSRIMKQYSGRTWTFSEKTLIKTRVWKITIERLTGRRSLDDRQLSGNHHEKRRKDREGQGQDPRE